MRRLRERLSPRQIGQRSHGDFQLAGTEVPYLPNIVGETRLNVYTLRINFQKSRHNPGFWMDLDTGKILDPFESDITLQFLHPDVLAETNGVVTSTVEDASGFSGSIGKSVVYLL